jgi:hypothetical protein
MEKTNKNKNAPQDIKLEYVPTEKQMELHTCNSPFILFGGSIAGGKGSKLDTPIITPHGFRTLGDIEAGDFVFDTEGMLVQVLTCTDHMYNHKCYEVTFDTGETITVDAEHLWAVYSYKDRIKLAKRSEEYRAKRRANRPSRGTGAKPFLAKMNSEREYTYLDKPELRVLTTEELFKTKLVFRPKYSPIVNYTIPVTKPLQFTEKKYKVSPYALGVFLGNGSMDTNYIACDYPDVQTIKDVAKEENLPWRQMNQPYVFSIDGIKPRLKEIGVLNNKHVPTEYLFGSYEQRLALIQGLMDTDGTVSKEGKAEFTSSLPNLTESLVFLLQSIGVKCGVNRNKSTLYGKRCKDRYRTTFRTTLPIFRLKRKLDRLPKKVGETCKYHYITDIKEVESVPVKCIAVDSPTKTYLATKSLIPTHNSVAGVNDMLQRALEYNNNVVGIYRWENQAFEKSTMQTVEEWILNNDAASKLILNHNKSKKVITLVNGSQIFYGGLKPSSNADLCSIIKSFERTAMFVDEVTDMPEHVFKFLCARIGRKHAIDPSTGTSVIPPQRLICSCNPHPGWVKKTWIDNPTPLHKFIKSTSYDNPHIGKDYIDNLKIIQTKEFIDIMINGNWDSDAVIDNLYSEMLVSRAVAANIVPSKDCNVFMGVDPAFYGDDRAVIVLARGDSEGVKAEIIFESKKLDPMELADVVEELYKQYEPLEIRIDAVGNNIDSILLDRGLPIQSIIGGALKDGFLNRRAELYWNLYELLRDGKIQLPDCQELVDEMLEIKFMRNASENKFTIEAKKDFKKRRGGKEKSPDYLDALVYACGEIADSYIIGGLV